MRAILVLVGTVLSISAFAEESYTIKVKLDPDVGKTVHYTSNDTDTGTIKFFDANGKLLFEEKKEGKEKSYRATVLARDKDGKPTKSVRTYETATEKEGGKSKVLSRQGRTIVTEKVDGKDRIGVVGEPALDAKDVEELYRDLGKKSESKALLGNLSPGRPVKVGDSWAVPVKPLVEALDDMPADIEKSSVTAKLVKVYDKGSSRFGTFEIAMRFILLGKSERDGMIATFEQPGEFTAQLTLDVAIDGTSVERTEKGTLAMKGEAAVNAGGKKLRVVFDAGGTGIDQVSAETDDPKAREIGRVVHLPGPGEWREFASKALGFTAKFPGHPATKSGTNDRGITTTEFSVQTENGKVHYWVGVSEYPADKIKVDAATTYANLKKLPGILESKDIQIAGLPGIELRQDVKKGVVLHITHRVVIVGQRMYQMILTTADGHKGDATQFFDSFQLDETARKKDD